MEIMLTFLFSHSVAMCLHLVNSWAYDVARPWDGDQPRGTVHCRHHCVPYSLPNQIGVSVLELLAVIAGDQLECQCQHLCWGIQLWLMITSLMFTVLLRSKHVLESLHCSAPLFKDKLKHLVFGDLLDSVLKKNSRETDFAFSVVEKDLKASCENHLGLTSFPQHPNLLNLIYVGEPCCNWEFI